MTHIAALGGKVGPAEGHMSQNHRISVGLSNTEHTELQELSEKHRVSVAWLGRQAIMEFLERCRSKEFQIPLAWRTDHAQHSTDRERD